MQKCKVRMLSWQWLGGPLHTCLGLAWWRRWCGSLQCHPCQAPNAAQEEARGARPANLLKCGVVWPVPPWMGICTHSPLPSHSRSKKSLTMTTPKLHHNYDWLQGGCTWDLQTRKACNCSKGLWTLKIFV